MLAAQPSLSIPGDGTREDTNSEENTQNIALHTLSTVSTAANGESRNAGISAQPKPAIAVADTNNRILAKVCQHLNHFTTYGPAIDEFYNWCRDERAYHPLNEKAILQCLEVIQKKAPECGMWSALRVFEMAMKYRHRLSPNFDAAISQWYEQLKGGTPGLGSASLPVLPSQPTSYHDNVGPPTVIPRSQPDGYSMSPPMGNGQPTRSSSSYPSPSTPTASAPSHPTTPILPQYGQPTPTMPTLGHVNINNPQAFTTHYQTAVVQWQQMWLLQQQLQQQQLPESQKCRQKHQHPGATLPVQPMNTAGVNITPRPQTLPAQELFTPIQYAKYATANVVGRSGQRSQGPSAHGIRFASIGIPTDRQNAGNASAMPAESRTPYDSTASGFMRPLGRALAPFKPEHNRPIATVNININIEIFQKLWMRTVFKLPEAHHSDKELPITLILNAWKANGSENKCEWPEKVELAVNGGSISPIRKRKVQVPNKASSMHMLIGKDRPLDLNPMLIPGANTITIKQNACACGYVFGVSLYLRESEELIRSRVISRVIDISKGQRLVNKLIGVHENVTDSPTVTSGMSSRPQSPVVSGNDQSVPSSEDDEIECIQESIKVNLRCPISLLRITEPVKGVACQHVECFDLNSYLCVNRGLSTWKCPVCSKVTISSALAYDAYFALLLEDMGERVTQIEYSRASRAWKPVAYAVEDDDDDGSDGEYPASSKPATDPAASVKRKANTELVNLISDDEDDVNDEGAFKRAKGDPVAPQQNQAEREVYTRSITTSTAAASTPSLAPSIPTPPTSTTVPFLHLPTRSDNTPPTSNWNIPTIATPGTSSYAIASFSSQNVSLPTSASTSGVAMNPRSTTNSLP